jgi:hypothetical protein
MSDVPPTPTYVLKSPEDISPKKRVKVEAGNIMATFLQGKTGYDVDKLISGTKKIAAYLNDDNQ